MIGFSSLSDSNQVRIRMHLENTWLNNFEKFDLATSSTMKYLNKNIDELENEMVKYHAALKNPQIINDNEELDIKSNIEFLLYLAKHEKVKAEEHLTSIAEMKIAFLFKSLEINLKNLINMVYPNKGNKNLYKWENMKMFFNNIDIKIEDIGFYNSVNELRQVNNNLKHTADISKEIKSIPEFYKIQIFECKSLIRFYNRVKNDAPNFLKNLVNEVIKDIFEYDENRLDNICNEYTEKMDIFTIERFIDKLQEKKIQSTLKIRV